MVENLFRELGEVLRRRGFKSSIRLAIMIYLLFRNRVLFNELLEVFDITPGNLWSHLDKLQNDGMVEVKYIIRNRPRVLISITDKGLLETMKVLNSFSELLSKYSSRESSSRDDVS